MQLHTNARVKFDTELRRSSPSDLLKKNLPDFSFNKKVKKKKKSINVIFLVQLSNFRNESLR